MNEENWRLRKALQAIDAQKEENRIEPSYYKKGKIEVIDFIEDQDLDFHLGNVVKYICRCKEKNGIEDLRKALWYLQRAISLEK